MNFNKADRHDAARAELKKAKAELEAAGKQYDSSMERYTEASLAYRAALDTVEKLSIALDRLTMEM